MKTAMFTLVVLILSLSSYGDISGTTVDVKGNPISGVQISLKTNGGQSSSENDGTFSLSAIGTGRFPSNRIHAAIPGISFNPANYSVTVSGEFQNVEIAVYNLNGRQLAGGTFNRLQDGHHVLNRNCHFSSMQMLLVRLKIGNTKRTTRILNVKNRGVEFPLEMETTQPTSNLTLLKAQADNSAIDTLQFAKSGFDTLEIAVAAFDTVVGNVEMISEDPFQNISFEYEVWDTVFPAFLNQIANLSTDSTGVLEFTVRNMNSSTATVDISAAISSYTDPELKTLTVAARSSKKIKITPFIPKDKFRTITEFTTINYAISAEATVGGQTKTLLNETKRASMTAYDVIMWAYCDTADSCVPLFAYIVGWVTPHETTVENLVSAARLWHPEQSLFGYQCDSQDGTIDGYDEYEISQDVTTISVSPGIAVLADSLPILPHETITWFVGAFSAQGGSGNDIITWVTNDGNTLYNSGQVHEGSYSVTPTASSGYMKLIFDNTFSWVSTKTVYYNYTYHTSIDITGTQVRAIFNSLKHDYSITYVNSPISYPDGTQRVLYPSQSLALNRANCIDGTVLFAAALENIGIEPFVMFVPGHAFLGYRQWPGSDEINFVETTMIGSSSFSEARAEGERKAQAAASAGNGIILDIKAARSGGLTPLLPKRRAN